MSTIHIYPCVRALLYAPIYLAIESFRYTDGSGRPEGEAPYDRNGVIEWSFVHKAYSFIKSDIVIRLHPPSLTGDHANYVRLKENAKSKTPDEIHIAVGDPAEALMFPPVGTVDGFHVLATLVDRVALWCVCWKPPASHLSEQQRRALEDLIGTAKQAPLFVSTTKFKCLRLGYSHHLATTNAIVEAFFKPIFECLPVPDPTTGKPGYEEGLGYNELAFLIDKKCDLIFSFEPWLIHAVRGEIKPDNFEILPWFHSVPYPFSSLVIYGNIGNLTSQQKALLVAFLKHCQVGLAVLYRFKNVAVEILKDMRKHLGKFGMQSEPNDSETNKILDKAFGHLFLADCFCENLRDSWQAWDLALEVNKKQGHGVGITRQEIENAFTESKKLDTMVREIFDWTFRAHEFRKILQGVVAHHGLNVGSLF